MRASRTKWSSKDIEEIANAAQQSQTLKALYLDNCDLDDQACGALAASLAGGSKVETLWLFGNRVGDQGAQHLASALQSESCMVTELNLQFNKISDEGATALAKAVENGKSRLQSLDLSCNSIGDLGAGQLAGVMEGGKCPELKILCLGGNKIKVEGSTRLSLARKSSKTMLFGGDGV